MSRSRISLAASVLLVSEDEGFANFVTRHLGVAGRRLVRLRADTACQPRCLREICPAVAFVDLDARTQQGLPLRQLIRNVHPDCEVIVIANLSQAAEAAELARLGEVFDYVLTDSVDDAHRIPLLVERATTRRGPSLAELRGKAKMEHRRVLETLNELRGLLKSRMEGPVVELLHRYKMMRSPFASQFDLPQRRAMEAYQHSVVDLICGRLKRLETLVELAEDKDLADAKVSSRNQILVVDDEAISLELAKFILEKNGFDVIAAESAAAAKRQLEAGLPALILMDIHLSDANGLRLVRALRSGATYRDVPIIVVTADGMRQTVYQAIAADIQGYVRKPYDPSLLIEKVKNALAESAARRLAEDEPRKDNMAKRRTLAKTACV